MREYRQSLLLSDEQRDDQGDILTPCFRCGLCCIGPRVHLTLVEARFISENLGTSRQEFEEMYLDPIWLGGDEFLLRQVRGACVFLKQEDGKRQSTCQIHSFRPFSCVGFNPGLFRKQCQAGLAKYWGLTVSPSSQLLGPDESIRDFYSLCSLLSESEEFRPAWNGL